MTLERRHAPLLLAYEEWKAQFRKDCETEDKLEAFNSLGEFSLQLLWKSGLTPTVRAVVGSIGNTNPTT